MTEKLAKLQEEMEVDPAPFGFANVPSPLRQAVSRELDLHHLSSSVVNVDPNEKNGMPDPKFLKSLKLKIFDGTEEYPDLGPNFAAWRVDFVQEVCLAQKLTL